MPPAAATFNLPNDTERLAIVGRTGSGKTVAAVWHLSLRDYDKMPWIIFNFKSDALLDAIRPVTELSLTGKPPTKPGLYIVRPMPHQQEELDEFLWRVWANGNTGLYFDEGYMVGNSKAFQAILTQGRSKHIPCIVLTQRPVWISRFVWSESDYYQIFAITNAQDQKTVRDFVPTLPRGRTLAPFHSIYHDVKANQTVLLQPVPARDTILNTFRTRLIKKVKSL
jgi:hypothetical protein